mmetsp:Transcript_20763/g.49269  ORF Transcript_20763/g.49269 Transcript_20763/m.49269 type:complete len:138 (+) Transcript_20763:159-572(+)|eukprot:CAMPEP_0177723206 /NCGR_PEP_ID=MMETSP0484_2-20121128/18092_1 /TAXON_ID=354590 /ORGANISM="Rhodomonas lens, Strain RHODO" /LENGTH=137 /DNA_ID=CAMNT_0019235633 /DNA_START=156 /DNA_END=569 /DNA_ORIENTATION=+
MAEAQGGGGLFGNLFACCDRRQDNLVTTESGGVKTISGASQLCGVGINFRADKTGALCVSSLIPGGPASRSGSVMVGDVLYDVDGKIVYRTELSNVSQNLLGPADSVVKVGFLRGGYQINVDIRRAPLPANMRNFQM